MKVYQGFISTISTLSNSRHQMFDSTFYDPIKSCNEVFNLKPMKITQELMVRASMLIDMCLCDKKHNGDLKLNFFNGLEIIQLSSGHTSYVYSKFYSDFIIISFIYFSITFSKMNAKIDMNPTGSA